MRANGIMRMMEDQSGFEITLGHPESLFYMPKVMIVSNDLLIRRALFIDIGAISLDPQQLLCFLFEMLIKEIRLFSLI